MKVVMRSICFCLMFTSTFICAQTPNRWEDSIAAPRYYIVNHTYEVVTIDGKIQEAAWNNARWSELFVDIEGAKKPVPKFKTRMRMLWSDSALFVAAELEEPELWATLRQHDEIIYHDNDFEVFIDPDNNANEYYEIEVNLFNTILDLFLLKPYRDDGRADLKWNLKGLKSAVYPNGTVNNPADKDTGWTVEMQIPFRHLHRGDKPVFPQKGSVWRINFSRVNWEVENKDGKYLKKKDTKGKPLPENNWVWSPQGIIDMHYPERWGYLVFGKNSGPDTIFKIPFSEKQKQYLWLIYYKQRDHIKKHREYAKTLTELQLTDFASKKNLTMMGNGKIFIATIEAENGSVWNINENGLIYQSKRTE